MLFLAVNDGLIIQPPAIRRKRDFGTAIGLRLIGISEIELESAVILRDGQLCRDGIFPLRLTLVEVGEFSRPVIALQHGEVGRMRHRRKMFVCLSATGRRPAAGLQQDGKDQ